VKFQYKGGRKRKMKDMHIFMNMIDMQYYAVYVEFRILMKKKNA